MGKEKTLHIYSSALINAFVRELSLSVVSRRKHTHTHTHREREGLFAFVPSDDDDDTHFDTTHKKQTQREREREREILSNPQKNPIRKEKRVDDTSSCPPPRRSAALSKHVTKHVKEASKHLIKKWKIFTGDRVVVTAGKDKGQIGQVTKVLRKENTLIVSGINLVKKHVKPQPQPGEPSPPGQIISVEQPIHYSNVSLVDPNTGGRVRIQSRFLDDGTKVRVTKGRLSSQTIVPKPDQLLERKTARGTGVGEKDTREDAVREVTYVGPR